MSFKLNTSTSKKIGAKWEKNLASEILRPIVVLLKI